MTKRAAKSAEKGDGKKVDIRKITLPADTPPLAKKEFERIKPMLLQVGYQETDQAALFAYLYHYGTMLHAVKQMNKKGTVIKTPNGSLQTSPYHSIARQNSELLKRWARELGLTQLGRKAMGVSLAAEDDDDELWD